jgi:hypothetical protein
MMGRNNNNKKKRLVTMTGTAAAITLLVASIVVIGTAQLSYQQQSIIGGGFAGRGFITSAMIADDTIVSADLKDRSAVRSSDIVDGQVKAEDLDPSIELGGDSSGGLSLQATERSKTVTAPESECCTRELVVSVQCNSDEVVTGGGYEIRHPTALESPYVSKRQDNGWSIITPTFSSGPTTVTVYAECLKAVNDGGTTG